MSIQGKYKIGRNDWGRLAKKEASIKRVTSIDVGTVTYSVATVDRESKELLFIRQFDLASLFGFKNGKATGGQLQWIRGMKQVFDDNPELFSGDLIVVERQMKTTAVGRMCSSLLDITLTHFQALGREIQIGDPKGVKKFMAKEDERIANEGTIWSFVAPEATATSNPIKGYKANKDRSTVWLKHILTPAQFKTVTMSVTKKGKFDDLAEAIRQALWVETKLIPPPRKRTIVPLKQTKQGKKSAPKKTGKKRKPTTSPQKQKMVRKPAKKKSRVIVPFD